MVKNRSLHNNAGHSCETGQFEGPGRGRLVLDRRSREAIYRFARNRSWQLWCRVFRKMLSFSGFIIGGIDRFCVFQAMDSITQECVAVKKMSYAGKQSAEVS